MQEKLEQPVVTNDFQRPQPPALGQPHASVLLVLHPRRLLLGELAQHSRDRRRRHSQALRQDDSTRTALVTGDFKDRLEIVVHRFGNRLHGET